MDTQQSTALTRALAEVPGPLPASGVIHIVIPHTSRFTVVGNHLAQHPGLSSTAVGIAVRIQSLPPGADVGIKALAARFPEGESRIAAALRELEAHGYLQRTRTRLPGGRIVTRTVFCNQPAELLRTRTAAAPPTPPGRFPAPTPAPPPAVAPAPMPEPPAPQAPVAPAVPEAPGPAAVPEPHPPVPAPAPAPSSPPCAPPRSSRFVPPPTAPKPPPPPLPQPRELTPELHRTATALVTDLRRHAPQLALSENDVRHLAPGVAAWLEREAPPDTIRHALTNDLPRPLRHPAKLLRHRLTALLPPPLPGAHDLALPRRRVAVTPFQTCDGCDRAFRSHSPGHCRDCRTEPARTAA
ncbi:hypothetical protein OHA98_35165 [Streptomyces sp. NBC_00654]|uniref:hypothetical protein n=1 Tax=Streptomyces sp. NBC_00654 TaxID=2975799 RepID=UPI00225882EB|nr:hypothetical protein [Streptomyces sp. NBC_00654]MCX4969907.1 hypothetical protein [Streptomyces sp. NBC_00654]